VVVNAQTHDFTAERRTQFTRDLAHLPDALHPLTKLDRWVVWKWETNDKGQATKVPYRPDAPSRTASSIDPSTWGSYETAINAFEFANVDGIGFCLFGSEVAAFDIDDCRNGETGEIDPWARALVDRVASYTEVTISGTGLRIIGRGSGPKVHRKQKVPGSCVSLETYRNAERYIVITGAKLDGSWPHIATIDEEIDELVAELDAANRAKLNDTGGDGARTEDDAERATPEQLLGRCSEALRKLIRSKPSPFEDRSAVAFTVLLQLIGKGFSDGEIETLVTAYPIGRRYVDGKDLVADIGRAREKKTDGTQARSESETGSWEEPDVSLLDDRRGELPPFPVEVMPTWADWLRSAAEGAGVTPGHVAVPLLSIASSIIGTARRIRASRAWSEPLALWTGVVGVSGTGKTPGIDVTMRALSLVEDSRRDKITEMRRRHEARLEASKAARKKWKQEVEDAIAAGTRVPDMPREAIDPGPFVAPRLVVTDATTERLAVLLEARPRGLSLVADELAGLFLNMARYSNGSDREFWLQAWNGRAHVVERQGRPPVELKYLLVGVTGGFQPDKLVKSFGTDEDGMYARLLLGWPEEASYKPLSNDVDEVEPEFQNALGRLVDLPAEDEDGTLVPRAIWLSRDAISHFEHFRRLLHGQKHAHEGREREWMAKGPGQVLRLSGTLAYLDWAMTGGSEPTEVGTGFVAAAVRLWRDYFWPHSRAALRLIGLSDRHVNARRALHWIRAHERREVAREDIRRDALTQRLDAEQTQALIDSLMRAGWLNEMALHRGGPGRRSRRWAVNPRLFL
jgi:hypothetical protein